MSDSQPPEENAFHEGPSEGDRRQAGFESSSLRAGQGSDPVEGSEEVPSSKPPVVLSYVSGDSGEPILVMGADGEEVEVFEAEYAGSPAAALPLWPPYVAVLVALAGAFVASAVAIGVAAVATGNIQSLQQRERQTDWLMELATSPLGLSVLVLPGQIVFAAVAIGAAWLSREHWVDRLGLRAGTLPRWTWPAFMIGTPVVGMLAAQMIERFTTQTSDHLQKLEQMFQFNSPGSLITLLLLVGVLPGIAEELLFRGFMQRRLLTRLPVSAAIVISSFFFAAAHMDVMHAIGVFPLGIWLGVIAWRADSVWPAVLAHIANNAFAIVMASVVKHQPDLEKLAPVLGPVMLVVLLAFVASIALLTMGSRRKAVLR